MMNTAMITKHPGRFSAGLAALCILLATPALADIYKWTGEDGKVNYTQMPPPPGYSSELIKQSSNQPSSEKQADKKQASAQASDAESPTGEQPGMLTDEQKKENEEIRKLNCDAASRNLAALLEKSQRSFMTANGELLRPTEKEREKLIANARKQVKQFCNE